MRVVDLDRDHSSVIPTGMDLDSEFLYERMATATYDALRAQKGARVVDSAAGLGQDGQSLAERGVHVVNVEPSKTMGELAVMIGEKQQWKDWGSQVTRARGWSEALPFRADSFDAAFCKGSIDHFDDPARAIAEMARITRSGGRVVVAVANFDSLGCRVVRAWDRVRTLAGRLKATRKHYHVPSDHFTRFDLSLIREQFERSGVIEEVIGVSALWGVANWARLLKRLPVGLATALLRGADAFARFRPSLADILVVAGRPRA